MLLSLLVRSDDLLDNKAIDRQRFYVDNFVLLDFLGLCPHQSRPGAVL